MEIIPKPKRKIPSLENIFLYISFFVFVFTILFSVILLVQENIKKKESEILTQKITSFLTPELQILESEFLKYKNKIDSFSALLDNHLFYSKIFPLIENHMHKSVSLSNMSIDFEGGIINFSGISPNFYIIGQQAEVLKRVKYFKSELKNMDFGGQGISFEFEVSFDKDILK